MPNLTQLRIAAREIFDEALTAINPYDAVRRAVRLNDSELTICDVKIDLRKALKIYSIAIGKAAMSMADALEEILGDRLTASIISTNTRYRTAGGNQRATARATSLRHKIFAGGHPEPNDDSMAAAKACFELLQRADEERALIFFSVSGGGSAMLEWPISENISLADLRVANKVLVSCGASISEINIVRRAFSAVKGGRLAVRARESDQITLIVSDVPRGQEYNVASGPTLTAADGQMSARQIVARYQLRPALPRSVLRAIDSEQPCQEISKHGGLLSHKHFVLLDNNSVIEASAEAASKSGFTVERATDICDQSIESGCAQLLDRMERAIPRTAIISGGEFRCPIRGNGLGGRNLETALRLACSTSSSLWRSENLVALCAGTDGIDGNSPAAGAIVDNTTLARAQSIGLDPKEFLQRSDSYSFFVALGDVITTGPTGTNVRDLRILLR